MPDERRGLVENMVKNGNKQATHGQNGIWMCRYQLIFLIFLCSSGILHLGGAGVQPRQGSTS